jgi:hypothetical protein
MLKSLLLIVLALAIALGGGAGSVWLMMEEVEDFGALSIGEWSVNPTEGTPQADPYAKARFAREGKLSLGAAEGAQFVAARDTTGQPLRGACDYVVTGSVPASRFWTMQLAADRHRRPLPPGPCRLRHADRRHRGFRRDHLAAHRSGALQWVGSCAPSWSGSSAPASFTAWFCCSSPM